MLLISKYFTRRWVGCSGIITPLQREIQVRHASPLAKAQRQVTVDGRKITIQRESQTNQYNNIWLRDHCQCKECLHGETKQRLLDILSIPRDIRAEAVTQDNMGLRIIWQNDHHESYFPWSWLQCHSYGHRKPKYTGPPRVELWGAEVSKDPPVVQYKDVIASDKGVAEWTSKIREFGFCYIDGCPISPKKTQDLLERISFIRPTHYGGFYDFTANLASKDTAYTSLALQAHTDTTYFSDPAGLQMFHLLSHTDGSGGKSLLVDGFAAAKILQKEAPGAYEVLSHKKIRYHASGNEGISIQSFTGYPVFNQDNGSGSLYQIRWNSSDRATMDNWHSDELLERWYEAAWKWCEILRRPEVEYWEQLQPGKPLSMFYPNNHQSIVDQFQVFDNWRVLHGRSAFTGKRRICGGYINYDDYMSRYRMTNIGREGVLQWL